MACHKYLVTKSTKRIDIEIVSTNHLSDEIKASGKLNIKIILAILLAAPVHASLLDNFEHALEGGKILWPMALAVLAGFLTTLSPCVYPLIPITLTVMGAKRYQSRRQGFLTALSYVAGMSLIYCALGAIFAFLGLIVGSVMQQPFVLVAIALLFIVLAASLFGIFDLVIPASVQTKLTAVGGAGFRGAFLMGMVAGVLAAPCTGPILGFILTLITDKSDVFAGIMLMLAFSLGMGAPFLLLGTFFGTIKLLPKSGPWMNIVKRCFGAIILGTAWYYLSLAWSFVHEVLLYLRSLGYWWLLAILVMGMALLASQSKKYVAGAFLASLAVAAMLTFEKVENASNKNWHIINSSNAREKMLEEILAEAKSARQPVLIDFYADWCVACKQLELLTFSNAEVAEELRRFTLVRIDATSSSPIISDMENRFRVVGLPTVLFIDQQGEVSSTRVLGFMVPEKFLPIIKNIR